MEKRVAFLIAFSVVFLFSLVLFKIFFLSRNFKAASPTPENATQQKEENGSGYIKLPSGQRGAVKYSGKVVVFGSSSTQETYELLDSGGNLVILLTAEDAKLKLAEGRFVEVSGSLEKNVAGEDVLKVEAIAFK